MLFYFSALVMLVLEHRHILVTSNAQLHRHQSATLFSSDTFFRYFEDNKTFLA